MTLLTRPVRIAVLAAALALLDFAYRSAAGDAVTWLSAALSVLGGVLLALVFAWLVPRLTPSRGTVVAVLAFSLFLVEFVLNMVEGYFFSTVFASLGDFLAALPAAALVALLQAVLAVLLVPAAASGLRFRAALAAYTQNRALPGWILRWGGAAVLYFPVYFAFGAIVGPMVLVYYSSSQTGLVLPDPPTILAVELVRGALYVLALFPVLAILRWGQKAPFLAAAALVYVPGSFLPLVTRTWLPIQVITLQSLELLGDAVVYAFILSRILAPKARALQEGLRAPAVAATTRPR